MCCLDQRTVCMLRDFCFLQFNSRMQFCKCIRLLSFVQFEAALSTSKMIKKLNVIKLQSECAGRVQLIFLLAPYEQQHVDEPCPFSSATFYRWQRDGTSDTRNSICRYFGLTERSSRFLLLGLESNFNQTSNTFFLASHRTCTVKLRTVDEAQEAYESGMTFLRQHLQLTRISSRTDGFQCVYLLLFPCPSIPSSFCTFVSCTKA